MRIPGSETEEELRGTQVDVAPTLKLSGGAKASLGAGVIVLFAILGWVWTRHSLSASDVFTMIFVASVVSTAVALPGILQLAKHAKQRSAFLKATLEAALAARISSLPDFTVSHDLRIERSGFLTPFATRQPAIFVDEGRRRVCLVDHLPDFTPRYLAFHDLLGVEISEDGVSVVTTKTSRVSQLGGALVGSALFGGAGAIIGGLSGKTVSTGRDRVRSVQLRLLVNDTSAPYFSVEFLTIEVPKSSAVYSDALRQARHWHGVLEVLVRRGDDEPQETARSSTGPLSVADELRKLVDLRNEGVLTEEEFTNQKHALLSGRS